VAKNNRYKRFQSTLWPCRRTDRYPNAYVKVLEDGKIDLAYFHHQDGKPLVISYPDKVIGTPGIAITFDRRLAALVAKRILQALKASSTVILFCFLLITPTFAQQTVTLSTDEAKALDNVSFRLQVLQSEYNAMFRAWQSRPEITSLITQVKQTARTADDIHKAACRARQLDPAEYRLQFTRDAVGRIVGARLEKIQEGEK
jgi:hypothetical protein